MSNGILYIITVLIWGSTWLAIKYQLNIVPPELSIAYRFTMASIILFIFSLVRRLRLKFSLREHAFIALQGLLMFSLNYFLVYVAEMSLTSGLVSIISANIIICNVIFGAIFLGNRIRVHVIAGAIFGLVGIAMVFWPEISTFDLSSERALGLIFAFIASIIASLGNIVSARNQRVDLPIVQTNAYAMGYGALFMVLVALIRGSDFVFNFSGSYIASLLYLALFGSVIAFGSYLTLLGKIGPEKAAYVTILFPIIALLLSTLFEGMIWTLSQIFGIVLVLIGNAIVLTKFQVVKLFARERKPSTTQCV